MAADQSDIPHSIEAEVCVLGGMMLEPMRIPETGQWLAAADFYRPAHQVIFSALTDMSAAGQPVDLVLLEDELKARGKIEAAGGIEYLVGVVSSPPDAANVEYYAKIVRKKSLLRSLITFGARVSADAHLPEAEPGELLEKYQAELYDLAVVHDRNIISSAGEAVREAIDHAEAVARGEIPAALSTGFYDIDEPLGGGFRPGQLIILAAPTSHGKTAFAMNVATHVAAAGGRVFLLSAEMKRMELGERLLQAMSGVESFRLRKANLNEFERAERDDAARRIAEHHFAIVDRACAANHVQGHCRIVCCRWQASLNLIIVDYLQLLHTCSWATGRQSRAQEISQMAWTLKQMAMDLNCPVLLLSQLSREGTKQGPPEVHHLKESGDIENHADVVILLHRPEDVWDETDPAAQIVWVKIGKARGAMTTLWPDGKSKSGIKLKFKRFLTRFESIHSMPEENIPF